jgi:hypothetical protein
VTLEISTEVADGVAEVDTEPPHRRRSGSQ